MTRWVEKYRKGAPRTASGKARTPREPQVWEGDRRECSVIIREQGKPPVSPDVVFWVDARDGRAVGHDVLPPDAPIEAIGDSLRKAIEAKSHRGASARPAKVRMRSAELAEAIRPTAEALGVEVEVAEQMPLLDALFNAFEETHGSPANMRYLESTGAPEAVVRDLFAAAGLFRTKPWQVLTDHEPIVLECSDWALHSRYAVILGASRQVFGAVLYESRQDLEELYSLPVGSPGAAALMRRARTLSVLLYGHDEVGPRRLAEAEEHGWALASPEAYPMAIAHGRGYDRKFPEEPDLRILVAMLQALVPLFQSRGEEEWRRARRQRFVDTREVEVAGQRHAVTATFPGMPPGSP